MSEPIKVLQVNGVLNRGGAETMIMNYYRALDKGKIQFDFVVHSSNCGAYEEEAKAMGANIYHCPRFTGKNYFEYKKWWKKFFSEHKDYKIIHSHIRSTASVYLPIARKSGVKTIIHSHSTSNGSGISSFIKKIFQYPLRFCSDYFFTCSDIAGKWLYGNKIARSNKYYIIRNAIDTQMYSMNEYERNNFRSNMGWTDKKVFIHVGRFHEAKNHSFLIKLFAEIHKKCENSILVLVGGGEKESEILRLINENQLNDSVVLLGVRSDVADLLQAADVFLFPSLWEGFPVTVIEAQAAGLPCYISNTITTEVNVSKLVHMLPIDKGVLSWTDKIIKDDFVRKDVKNDIIKSGFDIKSATNWLEDFYLEILSE